jgi:hypothetical protein
VGKESCAPRVFSEDKAHLDSIGCVADSGDWWKSGENANQEASVVVAAASSENVEEKENADNKKDNDEDEGGGGLELTTVTNDNTVSLVPLVQWYDSTHIASTTYYREFVFDRKVKRVTKGGFIEDKLGQQQLQVIKEGCVSVYISVNLFFSLFQ